MPTRFNGKVSVVTGGASGIGEGIVRRLVAEGGRCLIADVQEERGRALAQELGDAARFLCVDVSVEDDVARMVSVAVSELGGLDCLFDAGILGVVGSLLDTALQDWTALWRLLTSVFLGIKHGARVMRAQGSGAIVNTARRRACVAGSDARVHRGQARRRGRPSWPRSSDAAGIRVNAIAPGATVSGLTASVVAGDPTALGQVEERLAKRFGRAARPEDVAAAAVFLASDEAWYVNGACLVVDAASEVPGAKARRYFETVDD